MSGTLVQRFYEIAKLKAESPALGLEYGGAYHDLPWWFVKSKAKHFGMGLLEAGAHAGEYFYLLASEDPSWIYAELGALTVGLKTLPLPRGISPSALEILFKRFPPAFLYGEGPDLPLEALRAAKGLRRLILAEEDLRVPSHPHADTFRRVFNAGIRCEAKHHIAFRRLRESAEPSSELSPIRVDADGLVREAPLLYSEVQEIAAKLSQAMGKSVLRRLLAQADLSRTMVRVACLYWPLLLGAQAILLPQASPLNVGLKRFRPEVLYAPPSFLKEASEALSAAFPGSPGAWSPAALRRRWRLHRFRRRLHLSSPALLLHEAGDAELVASLANLGIATQALEF